MVRSDAHEPGLNGESLYSMITSWAAQAPTRLLGALMLLATIIGLLAGWVDERLWPLSAAAVTLVTVCLWGILDRLAERPHRRAVQAAEIALVTIGVLAATLSALGVLFRLMGPAPIL